MTRHNVEATEQHEHDSPLPVSGCSRTVHIELLQEVGKVNHKETAGPSFAHQHKHADGHTACLLVQMGCAANKRTTIGLAAQGEEIGSKAAAVNWTVYG
jgi:hypothetical protein